MMVLSVESVNYGDEAMTKRHTSDNQSERFKRAARDAGADMTKDGFTRVVGGLATPKPETADREAESDRTTDDRS